MKDNYGGFESHWWISGGFEEHEIHHRRISKIGVFLQGGGFGGFTFGILLINVIKTLKDSKIIISRRLKSKSTKSTNSSNDLYLTGPNEVDFPINEIHHKSTISTTRNRENLRK